ncbi:MAG: hypothetical protein QMD82_02175 [bacterium]|nr:hypothetical protein [bacterium]
MKKFLMFTLFLLIIPAKRISAKVSGFVISNYEYTIDGPKTGKFYMPFVWLIFSDNFDEQFGFNVWYDFQNSGFLMGWVDIKLANYFNVSAGKLVAPSNQEWYTYPPDQLTPFFSEVSGLVGVLGKGMDYGLGISGNVSKITYNLAVLQGDDNDYKDFCGRITLNLFDGFYLSGHTYQIRAYASGEKRAFSGIDINYTGFNFDLRAEYDFGMADTLFTMGPNNINPQKFNGYYVMIGYSKQISSKISLQPVVKYSVFEPKVSGFSPVKNLIGGLNLIVGNKLKVMIAYRNISDDSSVCYTDAQKKGSVVVRTQLSF